jgi:hypothetical protein
MKLKMLKKLLARGFATRLRTRGKLLENECYVLGSSQKSTDLNYVYKGQKQYMLHRKIYQLCGDGREVCVFLRDQQRWIERARIIDVEGI